MKIRILAIPILLAAALGAAYGDYVSAQEKFRVIGSERLKPGTRVELTAQELNAWAEHNLPAGVRNPRLEFTAPGVASGAALIDFGKLQRAEGQQPGWLMSMLLDGERPVGVTARIRSSGGRATVDVERVRISGLDLDGRTLDFLIRNFLLPLYPDAAVGRPFELSHRIDRLDVQPNGVGVIVGR
jgi:hypothetical protein